MPKPDLSGVRLFLLSAIVEGTLIFFSKYLTFFIFSHQLRDGNYATIKKKFIDYLKIEGTPIEKRVKLVSAKTDYGIEEAFKDLISRMMD